MSKLLLLNDAPVGAAETDKVAFNHDLYAGLLRDALMDNSPGTAVGFFARWGQGKSTVVNLLKQKLRKTADVVVFNAYHARGDSVRRQLLLAVLRKIAPDKAQEFERFSQIVTPLELTTSEEQKRYGKRNILRLLFIENRFDPVLVGSAILTIVFLTLFLSRGCLVLFGGDTFEKSGDLIGWLSGAFAACGVFVIKKIDERKQRILAYTNPISDSQRLKYPEQFSKVFRDALEEYCNGNEKRLVVVVDDLDRCEPGTVVEALASVRQFCHGESNDRLRCQFLVPCDEHQMVSALEADGYKLTTTGTTYHNYSETEMLRKFFDFTVRMDELVPESLADYAANLADVVGVDQSMAREMVDAAGIREPRKVKSLLNSMRIALETVRRNQAAGNLPPSEHLDRLNQTLATMVCLQELAPTAYEAIRENSDLLAPTNPGDPFEKNLVASRILAGLGPISVTTLEVLLTKHEEPSLRGCAAAHTLPAAVRGDRGPDVIHILKDAPDGERDKLVRWIVRKILEARSGARIRQLFLYLLNYGVETGWKTEAIREVVPVLAKKRSLLPGVLELGVRMGPLSDFCATLSTSERQLFDECILKNYATAPQQRETEETYLLRFSNSMSQANGNAFRRLLEENVISGNSPDIALIQRISAKLTADASMAAGFAPDLGERMLNALTTTKLNEGVHEIYRAMAIRLIGANDAVAARIFTNVIEKSEFFKSPQQLNEDHFRTHAIFFDLIHDLLGGHAHIHPLQTQFQKRYLPWLEAQGESKSRLRLIRTFQPGWGSLVEPDLARIGQTLGNWVSEDKTVARGIVEAVDEPETSNPAWIANRDILRSSIVEHFVVRQKGQTSLIGAANLFVESVKAKGWKVDGHFDALLVDKVQRFTQGQGSPPIDPWFNALVPIGTANSPALQKAFIDALTNLSDIKPAVMHCLRIFWSTEIQENFQLPLANALVRLGNQSLNDEIARTLPTKSGFRDVASAMITQIARKGPEWLRDQSKLVELLSTCCAQEQELSEKFQGAISVMLTSNNAGFVDQGVQFLSGHKDLTADTLKYLKLSTNGRKEGDPTLQRVRSLLDDANDTPKA